MISVKPVENKKDWEAFVLNYEKSLGKLSGGLFLQSWVWGDFQKNLGKEIFRLGVYSNKTLVGISLIYLQKAKTTSFFYVSAGPLFSRWTKKYFEEWLKFTSDLAKKKNAVFLRVEPRMVGNKTRALLKESGFVKASNYTQPKCTAIFDLTKSEESLTKAASNSTRYNIRASARKGVNVREVDPAEIKTFVGLLNETAKRKSLDLPIEKDYHKIQFETLHKEGMMKMFVSEAEGEALGTALVLFYGESAYYLHAANSLKKKQLRASYPLVWHALLESKRANLKRFDFWGIAASEDTRDPWAGVTSFKLSFGAERICFDPVYDLPFKSSYLLTKAVESWRKPVKKILRFGR